VATIMGTNSTLGSLVHILVIVLLIDDLSVTLVFRHVVNLQCPKSI
jgi:hypothetical protein